jgi:hypothetical protein
MKRFENKLGRVLGKVLGFVFVGGSFVVVVGGSVYCFLAVLSYVGVLTPYEGHTDWSDWGWGVVLGLMIGYQVGRPIAYQAGLKKGYAEGYAEGEEHSVTHLPDRRN